MLDTALNALGKVWNPDQYKWLLGGSCSLLLQGVELTEPPNDIDVYADFEVAKQLHKQAGEYSVDKQQLDRSGIYTSLLSHYQMEKASVELSGGFEVCAAGSLYRTDTAFLIQHAENYNIPGSTQSISITPLSHELLFNVLRRRADRYIPIARKMNEDLDRHAPIVRNLISRNVWSTEDIVQLETLLGRKW